MAVEINPERLLRDLRTLRTFGGRTDCLGVERVTYSEPDMKSRRWLVERMTAAGLNASVGTCNIARGYFVLNQKGSVHLSNIFAQLQGS